MLLHGTGVEESKKVDGRPWNTGMDVSRMRTGLKPNGTAAAQAPPWYANSVGEHILQTVSLMRLHGVATSDPSMHRLQGTQVKEPEDGWITYAPSAVSLW
jgi:hypothetical protein